MTEADQYILDSLRMGQYVLSNHALKRMEQRNVTQADIVELGKNGCVSVQDDGKYAVAGVDSDGDSLTAIVALEDEVLIVTLKE